MSEGREDHASESYSSSSYAEQIVQRELEHRPCDPENWLNALQDFTFPTLVDDLSRGEALAITHMYQTMLLGKNTVTQTDANTLTSLEARIDKLLSDTAIFPDGKGFIRLSNRSPKDGNTILDPYDRVAEQEQLQSFRDELKNCKSAFEANFLLARVMEAGAKSLCIQSGKAAVQLLVSSERVYVDLLQALKCHEMGTVWATKLILRRWSEDVLDMVEFRCFVKNHRLTAISQYNHLLFIPDMDKIVEPARSEIVNLFLKIDPLVGLDDYVVDIGFSPESNSAVIVELNPFATSTGACLYDWNRDSEILNGTCTMVEGQIRFHKVPLQHVEDLVQVTLDEAFREVTKGRSWLQVLQELNFTSQPSCTMQ